MMNQNQNQNLVSTTTTMDSRIWRHLPQPLVDRVLAFLPPPAFFRFRSVCRRWYSLLFSDSFLESHLRLSPPFSWFAFFLLPSSSSSPTSPLFAFLLDPATLSWYRLPLSSLIPPSFSPAASSSGLLCFLSTPAGPKTLLVTNPISNLTAVLPPTQTPRLYPTVGFAATDSSISAVVAGDNMISPFAVKNLTSETFHADAAAGYYSPYATQTPLPRLCNLDPSRMVFSHGSFYCMSSSPFAVLVYDAAGNYWSKVQPPMRRFLRSPSLVALGTRVALVAAVEKSRLSVPRSVRVWSLQQPPRGAGEGGRTWAEVDRMPPDVHEAFCLVEAGGGFECVAHGAVVAFTTRAAAQHVLLFDSEKKEWKWAPSCPFLSDVASGGIMRGFAYSPRLATPAIGLLSSS
ncbi:protein ABERRANT PANICLE ORGANIZATION 1 [Typha latifolia]|uniref:protein ABERRANT PANICLE ORGANIZATION 1 n=1 Tax=Typha latifolia TaxID=4733 RepID=UPI003C2AB51A